MKKSIAININFDSLNQNLGFPKKFKDPLFFKTFDRFLAYSDKYNFKYSIYIIGKDLENKEIFARVKEWSQQGHEIGNHSYTHVQNLGAHPPPTIEYEIMKAHELIYACTSKEPKGFIAPGWATSSNILKVLIKNNYLYDTSLFPSILTYAVVAKNVLNHLQTPLRLKGLLLRKDYLYPLIKPTTPFLSDAYYKKTSYHSKEKIVVFPIPTRNRFQPPIWHTLWFLFNTNSLKKELNKYLDSYDYFYYLMHTADLVDKKDSKKLRLSTIERINADFEQKQTYIDLVFQLLRESGRPIVTVEQLAKNFLKNKKEK